MKLLMIDTASIVATAAILDEHKLMGEIIINHKKKHSEKLLPAVDQLLNNIELEISDIDCFGVVVGPGSFTGLRIGLATVKGFAQALNKPIVTVNTLESLSANLEGVEGYRCPILDAQRNEVYTALYDHNDEVVMEPRAMPINELIEKLNQFKNESIWLLGDGIPKYGEIIKEQTPNVHIPDAHLRMNRGSSAAMVGWRKMIKNDLETYLDAKPLYLRKSYAEENKK